MEFIFNKKLPSNFLTKQSLMGTVTFTVLFAIVFLNIYIPFSDTAWFGLGNSERFDMTLIFIFSSISILIVSRMLIYHLKEKVAITYLIYSLWCIMEVCLVSCFYAFLTDYLGVTRDTIWEIFTRSLLYGSIAMIIPIILASMYLIINDKNNTIRLLNYQDVVTDEPVISEKITIFDNSGNLKLSLSPDNLFYIESDDNYIKVWYTDSKADIKHNMIRCRLKTIEEDFKDSTLKRCHRKYIVNMSKVEVLRRENDGYYLDLGKENIPSLPVSKTYEDDVVDYFTGTRPLLEPLDY